MHDSHDSHRWGGNTVNIQAHDLPGLKARFMIEQVPRQGRLLEVGCGAGKMLRTLAHHHPSLALHGCDVRALPDDRADFAFLRLEDPESSALPYESGSFDAVLLMDVLEHVPFPEATLDEVMRVLAPGGKLVAFVPCEGEPLGAHRLLRRLIDDDLYVHTKEHIQSFRHEVLDAMMASRFQVSTRRYVYHALGQTMDAALFAATRLPAVGKLFWSENQYYNAESSARHSLTSRLFNGALTAANALAYFESTLLAHTRLAAGGQLVVAERR